MQTRYKEVKRQGGIGYQRSYRGRQEWWQFEWTLQINQVTRRGKKAILPVAALRQKDTQA